MHVVTCTGGERGSILNPKMDRPDVLANISEIRRQEMERARDILGVRQDWLGFVDSGWPEGDPLPPLPEGCFALVPLEEAAAPLVRLIREFRPHVVTTYDERGGYPHPDHVKCHEVSVAAFEAAGDPERYPDLGEPWQPLKLYYHHSFNRPRMQAIHDAMLEHGLESPWAERLKEWKPEPEWDARITTRVPCAEFFGVRDQALLAHATQIDPDGFWFAIPREIQRRCGRPRTSSSCVSHVNARCPRTTCSPGSTTPEGHWMHARRLVLPGRPAAHVAGGQDPGAQGREGRMDGARRLPAADRGRRGAGVQLRQAAAQDRGRAQGRGVRARRCGHARRSLRAAPRLLSAPCTQRHA